MSRSSSIFLTRRTEAGLTKWIKSVSFYLITNQFTEDDILAV